MQVTPELIKERARLELRRRKRAELVVAARDDLRAFCEAGPITERGPFVCSPWQQHLCSQLAQFSADVAARKAPRLLLEAPPQFGKTEIMGRRWPLYHLGRYGGTIAYATYAQDLSEEHSQAARQMARDGGYADVFPSLARPESGISTIKRWDTERGKYIATSVGGPLTGKTIAAIVVDDPFKDRHDYDSAAWRKRVKAWWRSVVLTRAKANGAGIVVMQTRWGDDDLIGWLLSMEEEGGDEWQRCSYPLIAEPGDILGRDVGQILEGSPGIRTDEDVAQLKVAVGSYDFAALYQQRPSPMSGGMFRREWFANTYDTTPEQRADEAAEVVLSVDCASTKGSGSDFTVMQVWARTGPTFSLVHEARGRWEINEQIAEFRKVCRDWPVGAKLIEHASNGIALYQHMQKEYSRVIRVDAAGRSKERRAHDFAIAAEAGNILLPRPRHAPWVGDVIEEWCRFRPGERKQHDDRVDAAAYAIERLMRRKAGNAGSNRRALAGMY